MLLAHAIDSNASNSTYAHWRIQQTVWGEVLAEGPNLFPFSSISTDLGHFILKLLNFDIYFLFYVIF